VKVKEKIHINIGELRASKKPAILQTVLGSCVAACLYDPDMRIGGMNHILLPGEVDLCSFNDSARFGINAMELLINKIIGLGGIKKNLVAKVFGGGHVLPGFSTENSIGKQNVEFVKQFLEIEKIKIVSQHTGGIITRVVYFHTDTAEVLLKKIKSNFYKTIQEETNYLNNHSTEIIRPDVTLF